MNFLAHIYLSGENDKITAGNFLADGVKGNNYNDFEPEIRKGILLHRFIDNFTDHHPLVIEAKQFFVKEFDKYSGVLIDIFFDYFLAKNFDIYSDLTLQEFASKKYKMLDRYKPLFPLKAQQFYEYMVKYNILEAYSSYEGIEKVLRGMTGRIKNKSILYNALPTFYAKETELKAIFTPFFNDIKAHCTDFVLQTEI